VNTAQRSSATGASRHRTSALEHQRGQDWQNASSLSIRINRTSRAKPNPGQQPPTPSILEPSLGKAHRFRPSAA